MRKPPTTSGAASVATFRVPVRPPYRLDLTANVLRRLSTNVVDRFDGGVYRRLIGDPARPAELAVRQRAPDALDVSIAGAGALHLDPVPLVQRMLGTEVDTTVFIERTAPFPWLHDLARRAAGVRPPRYPSLWEALVNAIVFQQVSIHAAAAILGRTIAILAPARDGATSFAFPPPGALLGADPAALRAAGLSTNKLTALRALAQAIDDNTLDGDTFEDRPTESLVAQLVTHRGIGPWTAAVIALRGFGRLDIFPMKDSGASAGLRAQSGDPSIEAEPLLAALGDRRGLLYYHLLLGWLAARGEIELGPSGGRDLEARPGFPRSRPT